LVPPPPIPLYIGKKEKRGKKKKKKGKERRSVPPTSPLFSSSLCFRAASTITEYPQGKKKKGKERGKKKEGSGTRGFTSAVLFCLYFNRTFYIPRRAGKKKERKERSRACAARRVRKRGEKEERRRRASGWSAVTLTVRKEKKGKGRGRQGRCISLEHIELSGTSFSHKKKKEKKGGETPTAIVVLRDVRRTGREKGGRGKKGELRSAAHSLPGKEMLGRPDITFINIFD